MELIDNGMHSFKKAFKSLTELENIQSIESEYIIKDIILGLHHSLEVLFKYMLKKKDKTLIYEDLEKYYELKFNQTVGSPKIKDTSLHTVKFMEAFKRVIVCYDIKTDNITYQSINKLNEIRNDLSHNQISFNLSEISITISNILFNIIPILEIIDEFKEYIKESGTNDQIKRLNFIRSNWAIQSVTYLLTNTYSSDIDFRKKEKHNALLKDFGFFEDEDNETSEKEFILGTCERLFYSVNFYSSHFQKEVDTNIKKYWEEFFDIYEKATIDILHNKIIKSLKTFLCAFNKENIVLTSENGFAEICSVFSKLGLSEKLTIGMLLKKIKFIIARIDDIDNSSNKKKKLFNEIFKFSFTKIKNFGHLYYEETDDANYDYQFEFSTKEYVKCLEKLYKNESTYFPGEEYFDSYINDERKNEIIDFICENSYDIVWSNLMGKWGEWGTIDNISEINCYDIDCIQIIDTNNSIIKVFCELEIGTERYSDHEFYPDGTAYMYVGVNMNIQDDDKISIYNISAIQ